MIEKIERLENENFSLKKEVAVLTHKSGCMLEQHVGTLLEKNVLNKKLKEETRKYDELKTENEKIKKELENARFSTFSVYLINKSLCNKLLS